MNRPGWLLAAVVAYGCAGAVQAHGREDCTSGRTRLPPIVNLRVDNDVLGGQDQGYSNGVQLTLVSPNLRDYTNDPCIPRLARWVNRHLGALQPETFEQQNMIATFAQGIFTPTDFSRSDLIEDDRPYAAALLVGLGYNAREGDQLRTTQLQFGIVGPAALGKQAQDAVHQITGSEKFRGWDNQLENEPVFRIVHERMRRFSSSDGARGWGWDTIAHYGGSFGNLATYVNTGARVPLRPEPARRLRQHAAASGRREHGADARTAEPVRARRASVRDLDTRWVFHDITLDGNTFRDSHSVDKRHAVANVGYGVALMRHRWKFALARYHGTREFDGQRETPVFGSFTISRAF